MQDVAPQWCERCWKKTIRKKIPIVPDPATAPDPAYRRPTKKSMPETVNVWRKASWVWSLTYKKSGDFNSYVWWCPPDVRFVGLSTPWILVRYVTNKNHSEIGVINAPTERYRGRGHHLVCLFTREHLRWDLSGPNGPNTRCTWCQSIHTAT